MSRDVHYSEGKLQLDDGTQVPASALSGEVEASGGGGQALLASWHWDDEPEVLRAEVHSIIELTTDPGPSGTTDLQTDNGTLFTVADDIDAAGLLAAFQAANGPDDVVVSVTGGPFGVAPFVVTLETESNVQWPSGDFEVVINRTQQGVDPIYGFYLDLGLLPEGALVTALYAAITEDFTFDSDPSDIEVKVYVDPEEFVSAVAAKIYAGSFECPMLVPELLTDARFSSVSRRLVATADRLYPALVYATGGEAVLTAGAVDWIATYITPPNPITLSLPSSDYWND